MIAKLQKCDFCNGKKKALYVSKTGWEHEERTCHRCDGEGEIPRRSNPWAASPGPTEPGKLIRK